MSKLFTNLEIKNVNFKNRIIMPPMCMYSAKNDGFANDFHLIHYTTRAIGGIGGIIVEATGIEPIGRITENDLGIWNDEHIINLKKIVDSVHNHKSVIGIQLNHAGRKSQTNGEIISCSNIPFADMKTPREMTHQDIINVIDLFKEAALRALKAGFDFIEIHGAHGYLICQFLSPLVNNRKDEYGGSIENRSRFLREIIKAVRTVWPKDKLLVLRLSVEEYDINGNHPEDLIKILNLIKNEGIDLIDVSSGGVINVKINDYPGYQLEYAKTVKEKTDLPVIAGGLIDDPKLAEFALRNSNADLIYVGRETLRNPYFPLQAAKILGDDIEWPSQYKRAKR